MSEIHIHRDHQLGLPRARALASGWIAKAQHQFGLDCVTTEGEHGDSVAMTRSGLDGVLTVADDHYAFDAKLGLIMSGFRKTIETEIEKNLDALLRTDDRDDA